MESNLNQVNISGRVCWGPTSKILPSGSNCCEFGVAINGAYNKDDGTTIKEITYVDITTFGKIAQNCANNLKRSQRVFLTGRLKFAQWEDKASKQKRSKLTITAFNVEFLPTIEVESIPVETAQIEEAVPRVQNSNRSNNAETAQIEEAAVPRAQNSNSSKDAETSIFNPGEMPF